MIHKFTKIMKGRLFVISGPSGSGKTTLSSHAVKNIDNLRFSVSFTTRPIRNGEVDGVDYFFVDQNTFTEMVKEGKFAEWAKVHGNLYGTPIDNIKDTNEKGVDILLDIDVQGAEQLKQKFPDAIFIFVVPPSMKVLRKRLEMRNSEKKDDISLRLNVVKYEIQKSKEYDYIIINDDMDAAGKTIESIIIFERNFKSNDSAPTLTNEHSLAAERVKSDKIFDEIITKRFNLR